MLIIYMFFCDTGRYNNRIARKEDAITLVHNSNITLVKVTNTTTLITVTATVLVIYLFKVKI